MDNGSFEIVSKVKYTPKEGEVTFSAEDFCYNTDFSSTKMDFTCYEDILITITKDCPPGTVCVSDGLTLECQPMPFEPTCMDGDGSNLEVKSDVSGMNIFGLPYKKTDACGPGNNYIIDYVCPSGNIGVEEPGQPSQNLSFCLGDTYCQEISPLLGAKELKCVQKCVDFDPNNDPQVAGVVVDFDGKESFDVCQGKNQEELQGRLNAYYNQGPPVNDRLQVVHGNDFYGRFKDLALITRIISMDPEFNYRPGVQEMSAMMLQWISSRKNIHHLSRSDLSL